MKRKRAVFWGALVLLVLFSTGTLFAVQADSGATSGTKGQGHWWKGILQGILGGVVASLIGWAKNKNTRTGEQEKFGFEYLLQTCFFGAIVGLVAGFLKKNPADLVGSLEATPLFGALTFLVEALFKAIWRHGVVKVRSLIEDFKAGSGGGNPTPPAPSPTPSGGS